MLFTQWYRSASVITFSRIDNTHKNAFKIQHGDNKTINSLLSIQPIQTQDEYIFGLMGVHHI